MHSIFLASLVLLMAFGPQGTRNQTPRLPEVGKPAPLVRLNDHKGEIAELGGKRANWSVLAFFPKAATPG